MASPIRVEVPSHPPDRKEWFAPPNANNTAPGTDLEGPSDLAYRGAPTGHGIATVTLPDPDGKKYAHPNDQGAVNQESKSRPACWKSLAAPLAITTALALGLQRVRPEYYKQTAMWRGPIAIRNARPTSA